MVVCKRLLYFIQTFDCITSVIILYKLGGLVIPFKCNFVAFFIFATCASDILIIRVKVCAERTYHLLPKICFFFVRKPSAIAIYAKFFLSGHNSYKSIFKKVQSSPHSLTSRIAVILFIGVAIALIT